MDKQVEYFLIQTFWLLKQIFRWIGHLFLGNNSRYLELFHKLELFPLFRDGLNYQKSTVDLFRRISSLYNS